jgi:hypothetical protein
MKNNDNHFRLFTRAISIEFATTWGRLYQLPAGFPELTCLLSTGWRRSTSMDGACIGGFWWWLNAKIGFPLAGHTMASTISSEAVCTFPVGTGTARNSAKLG